MPILTSRGRLDNKNNLYCTMFFGSLTEVCNTYCTIWQFILMLANLLLYEVDG